MTTLHFPPFCVYNLCCHPSSPLPAAIRSNARLHRDGLMDTLGAGYFVASPGQLRRILT
jgi:hypothetical protein